MIQWNKNDIIKKRWVDRAGLRDFIQNDEFTLQEVLDLPETDVSRPLLLEWTYEYITLAPDAKKAIEESLEISDSTDVFRSTKVEHSNRVGNSEGISSSSQVLHSNSVTHSSVVLNSDNVHNSSHVSCSSEVSGQAIFNSSFVYDSSFVVNSLNVRHSILAFNCKGASNLILCQNMENKDSDKYYFRNDEIPKESFERIFRELEHVLKKSLSESPGPFSSWRELQGFVEPHHSNLRFYYGMLLHYNLIEVLQKSLGNKIKPQELYKILMMLITER